VLTSRRLRAAVAVAGAAVVLASCAGQSPSAEGATASLVDLGSAEQVAAWTTVNDPVMGGQSTSSTAFGDGGLVFSGSLSLANNGGFASARSPENADIGRKAAGANAFRVRATGDGKTYLLKAGAAGQPYSYVQRFSTQAGVERDYDLPVRDFEPVGMRLNPAPDAPRTLDPSTLSQVAIYILDKQQGPFTITVRGIDAVR
jgi:hypothetical protein